jgi:hypothetical protein
MSNVEYKVWAHIERIVPSGEYVEDIGEPTCIGIFDTCVEANRLTQHLDAINIGRVGAMSYKEAVEYDVESVMGPPW